MCLVRCWKKGRGAYLDTRPPGCGDRVVEGPLGQHRAQSLSSSGERCPQTISILSLPISQLNQLLVLPGRDSSRVFCGGAALICLETYLIVVCCGSHSKAPKSSCELFRESGHEASITKCFSPSGNLGHSDLFFPHIWKSEIISLFSRNITVIENLF